MPRKNVNARKVHKGQSGICRLRELAVLVPSRYVEPGRRRQSKNRAAWRRDVA
jgi:hypothetical protein